MEDNYIKYQSMNVDDLLDEIEKINKTLFRLKEGTPMFNQLMSMRTLADQTFREKSVVAMQKAQKTPPSEILDIGEIESVEYTPNYNEDEVLNNVVESYTKTLRSQHENDKTKTRKTR